MMLLLDAHCDPSNAETAVLFAPGARYAVSGQYAAYVWETAKQRPFWVIGGNGGKWLTLSMYLEAMEVQRAHGRYFPADYTRDEAEEWLAEQYMKAR